MKVPTCSVYVYESVHSRALQIEAITVHKHLLASFLLNGAFYIFNTLYFVFPGSSGEHLVSLNDVSP